MKKNKNLNYIFIFNLCLIQSYVFSGSNNGSTQKLLSLENALNSLSTIATIVSNQIPEAPEAPAAPIAPEEQVDEKKAKEQKIAKAKDSWKTKIVPIILENIEGQEFIKPILSVNDQNILRGRISIIKAKLKNLDLDLFTDKDRIILFSEFFAKIKPNLITKLNLKNKNNLSEFNKWLEEKFNKVKVGPTPSPVITGPKDKDKDKLYRLAIIPLKSAYKSFINKDVSLIDKVNAYNNIKKIITEDKNIKDKIEYVRTIKSPLTDLPSEIDSFEKINKFIKDSQIKVNEYIIEIAKQAERAKQETEKAQKKIKEQNIEKAKDLWKTKIVPIILENLKAQEFIKVGLLSNEEQKKLGDKIRTIKAKLTDPDLNILTPKDRNKLFSDFFAEIDQGLIKKLNLVNKNSLLKFDQWLEEQSKKEIMKAPHKSQADLDKELRDKMQGRRRGVTGSGDDSDED